MDVLKELQKEIGVNRLRQNEPLSLHTTFKVGGPAKFYVEAQKIEEIVKFVKLAKKLAISYFILGGGSNLVASDQGFDGLVIKNNSRKFEIMKMSGKIKNKKEGFGLDVDTAFVYAESGVIMNQLVRFTIENGLGGLEYQLGLPGTVGGAVSMNSNFPRKNAYVGDCLYKALILTQEGEAKEVDKDYFKFAYDKSILQKTGEILLWAIFKMKSEDKKMLWERGEEAVKYRSQTQPKGFSSGCMFKNISVADAMRIPTPNNITSAGFLIDKAGLKGKRIGDAVISDVHANFIINKGQAKGSDIIKLIRLAKEEVKKKFGVELELEVKILGE